MNAANIMQALTGAGFTIRADDGELVIAGAVKMTDALREQVRANKPELLRLLQGQAHGQVQGQAIADAPATTPEPLPQIEPAARTCRACRHRARPGTCKEPAAAGLAAAFAIITPPAGHARRCPAFQPSERTPRT